MDRKARDLASGKKKLEEYKRKKQANGAALRAELDHDEILATVDSGNFLHALDADINLPSHSIEALESADRRLAETACGAIIKRRGTVRTEGNEDGEKVNVR